MIRRIGASPGSSALETSFGKIIRFNGGAPDFSHPFLATLESRNSASFLPGTVNGVMATIKVGAKQVPLPGTDKLPAPVLRWTRPRLDADGLGFLCVEVTLQDPAARSAIRSTAAAQPEAWAVLAVEMVQVADPDTDDGLPGKVRNTTGAARPLSGSRCRWPVAMLQRRSSDTDLELFQIVHFDLVHRVSLRADGVTVARHFFY